MTLPALPPGRLVLVNPFTGSNLARRDGAATPQGDELLALSFFDEDDEPRRTTPRPRRARPAGPVADSQTLLIRRAVALVGGLILLILLVIAVNSCRNSQKENALKDYNRELSAVATGSAREVGEPFFQLLSESGGGSPQDLETAISGYRVQAEQQYRQVRDLDVPGEMRGAQESALIALEWRQDGLRYIAERVRTALGDEGEAANQAIEQIAGQMQVFLASDVSWETRVIPFVKGALDDAEIGGQEIARSQFLPDQAWLDPQTVATELGQQLTTEDGGGGGEPTGPGLHGTGLDATSYGDTTLQPGTANQLTYTPGQAFTVRFTNQGENDEFDIKVTMRIQPESGDAITLSDTIPKLVPGESATAELPLEDEPPLDTAVTIRVTVARVPGEEKVDNNRSEYPAIFSQG
jgi:hypothetical protein